MAGLLDAPNGLGGALARPDHDDRLVPPLPPPRQGGNERTNDGHRHQAERERHREGDARIQRRELQGEGEGRQDEKAEGGHIREPPQDLHRTQAEARVESGPRIAEDKEER